MPTPDSAPDVTTLLQLAADGDAVAGNQLYARVYEELRSLARSYLRSERDSTMPPTALVHEAWLRLANQRMAMKNRGQFFGLAAQAMRRILVDDARARRSGKRDGRPITLDDDITDETARLDLLVAVDDAVSRLALIAPRQARVVELRWFADLEVEEVAEALDISTATVKREWRAARAWLHRALASDSSDPRASN
ncbi:MAG: ECF-type sigma factor [Gemmatimonadaceae bacterium]